MSKTFTLDDWSPPVPVQLIDGLTKEQLLGFRAFRDWLSTLKSSLSQQKFSDHPFHDGSYYLRHIKIQAFDRFGDPGRILFMKMFATVTNDANEWLPGVVFLRGGSVAVLMILRPSDTRDERLVIMTEQPRIAAGSLQFMEIPAGMLDDEDNFAGVAAREIKEEVGIELKGSDLVDMTKLAVKDYKTPENLRSAMYPSPGGCDEFISIFLWEREMDRLQIENLKDRLTGERTKQEKIIVRLLDYKRLLEVGARDGKTLAAWSLYEYLKRTGEIE